MMLDMQAFIRDLLAVNGRLDCFLNRLAEQMAKAPDLAWPRPEEPPWYAKAHEVVDGIIGLFEQAGCWEYWGYQDNGRIVVVDASTGHVLESMEAAQAQAKYPELRLMEGKDGIPD